MTKTERTPPPTDAPGGSGALSDRYVTIACLGETEHATTYWAREAASGDHVVVKIPKDGLLQQSSFSYLLERAALELLRVKHPHIVRVLDVGRAHGVPYVVTEYVDGASLAQTLLGKSRTQTPTQVYDWLIDIAEALDFIHAKKAVHGEVRPSHILYDGTDRWRLTDFAFASAMTGLDAEIRAKLAPTRPGFTAPEIADGRPPTAASDQYALAACAYFAIVGEPADADPERMQNALRRRLSDEAAEDVLRALASDPAARFASCYEFARAFGLERKRPRMGATGREAVPGPLDALLEPSTPARPGTEQAPPRAGEAPMQPAALAPVAGEVALSGSRCWRVRLGRRDEYARIAREGGFIAAGWGELGDLASVAEAADPSALAGLADLYDRTFGVGGLQARVGAGQVWRFLCEMQQGDVVLVPNTEEDLLHIGRIDGAYEFLEAPKDGCRLPRRRRVTWLRDVSLKEVQHALLRRLGGPKPLANVDAQIKHVRTLLSPLPGEHGKPGHEAVLLQTVLDALYGRPLDDFPAFLRGLFAAVRYDAELMPGRSDETWEAVGAISARGLTEVPLRVWVHRTRRDLDVDVVFAARGTLATDEQGAIVSLGGFTPRARAEAAAEGKKAVRLIDGRALAALAIENWEDLPPAVRDTLGVERIERASIEVFFRPR